MGEDLAVKLLSKLETLHGNMTEIKFELGVIKNDIDWIKNGYVAMGKDVEGALDDINHIKAELKSFHTAFKVLYVSLSAGFVILLWILDKAGVWARVFD